MEEEMGCSCSLLQSLPPPPWTPCDRKEHKWGRRIQSKEFSLSGVFYFHSLWPFCSSQTTSTGNGTTKQGASTWGGPFSLRSLATAFTISSSWKVCRHRAVFQCTHRRFDHCGSQCQLWQKKKLTERSVKQIQKCPRSGLNPKPHN